MLPPEYGGRAVAGKHDTTGVSRDASAATPEQTWQLALPLLNTRPLLRLANRRRTSVAYPARGARRAADYHATPPRQPAAIHVYDSQGHTRFLPLDLDAHDRTPEQTATVDADLATLCALLEDCGITYLADRAHGGAHVYALLADPISASEARTLAEALARRLPSLDPSPTRSAASGLITIPGSAHRLGGHRELTCDLEQARAIATGPHSPTSALRRLRTALAGELRTLAHEDAQRGADAREHARTTGATSTLAATIPDADVQALTATGLGRHMSPRCAQLATAGDWRTAGYPSPSEARRAVLMSAIATGLTEIDVRARMLDGRWPGLRSMFDHKGLHRLTDEYRRAAEEIHRREHAPRPPGAVTRPDTAVRPDTSAPTHTGGRENTPTRQAPSHDTYAQIRIWTTLATRHAPTEYRGAASWSVQMALRSLGQAASMVGSTVIAMGVRWHSLATDRARTDAARILRELADEPDPWITLVARGRGILADEYRLRIPDRHAHSIDTLRWRRGKTQAVRPAFTVLGTPTALLYEAIEHGHGTSRARLARATGLSDDAYRDARDTALAYGLITGNDHDGYELAANDADLERLAEALGALEARSRRIAQHRHERALYWKQLDQLHRSRPWIRHVRDVEDPDPEIDALLTQMRLDDLRDHHALPYPA